MNNKTIQFTCKSCNSSVYRLGSQVSKARGLCGRCNKQLLDEIDDIKVVSKLEKKVENPIDPYKKALEDYNKQWEKDKLETQSLEKFLNKAVEAN